VAVARVSDLVEQVLAQTSVPPLALEPGIPAPVAWWRGRGGGMVLFVLRRTDGSFHWLVGDASDDIFGGPIGDALPDRAAVDGVDVLAQVGAGGVQAVLGFAAAGAFAVALDFGVREERIVVHPETGAFIVGFDNSGLPPRATLYALDAASERIGAGEPIEFDEFR
jgi:hypothetical protein